MQVKILDENPDIDFVYSDAYQFADNKKEISLSRSVGRDGNLFYEHFFSPNLIISTMMFRKYVFDKLQFDESLRYNEDADLTLKVSLLYKGNYSGYPCLKIRHHRGRKSHNRIEITKALIKSYEDILRQYGGLCEEKIGVEGIERRMQELYSEYMKACILASRFKDISLVEKKLGHIPLPLIVSYKFKTNKVLKLVLFIERLQNRLKKSFSGWSKA